MKLILWLPPFLVACRSPDLPSHQHVEIRDVDRDVDVVNADAHSESPDAVDASASPNTASEYDPRTELMRHLRGDCPDGDPIGDYTPFSGAATPPLDLDAWLKAHHVHFPRDKSCPSRGPERDQCTCDRELLLPGRDAPLLRCYRFMGASDYSSYVKTILYALEGSVLRVVFEQATGLPGNNFDDAVPWISFVPRVRNDTLVFEEAHCRGCPVAMEFFASNPGFKKAHADYKKVCSLDSWEWKWNHGQLKKYRRTASISSSPTPVSPN